LGEGKQVLKQYCDFVDDTRKKVHELLKLLDDNCKLIGCKSEVEDEPFMDCNVGCPLFWAWQFLDRIRKTVEETETK